MTKPSLSKCRPPSLWPKWSLHTSQVRPSSTFASFRNSLLWTLNLNTEYKLFCLIWCQSHYTHRRQSCVLLNEQFAPPSRHKSGRSFKVCFNCSKILYLFITHCTTFISFSCAVCLLNISSTFSRRHIPTFIWIIKWTHYHRPVEDGRRDRFGHSQQ